jgi:hypothetical protein
MYVNNRTNESHIEGLGFEHFWIGHKEQWVHDIFTQIHTNNIERSWRSLKSYISGQKRTLSADILNTYINAFVAMANTDKDAFFDILMTIFATYLSS